MSTRETAQLDQERAVAIATWRQARDAELAGAVRLASDSREDRMDQDRRREVLARQDEAIAGHAPLDVVGAARVVLAHRNAWYSGKLSAELEQLGMVVVASVLDGADAVGTCIAEQPDLLVLDDVLARMTGVEVLREVARFCPGTACVAQTAHSSTETALLAVGAHSTHPRHLAPVELAHRVAAAAMTPVRASVPA